MSCVLRKLGLLSDITKTKVKLNEHCIFSLNYIEENENDLLSLIKTIGIQQGNWNILGIKYVHSTDVEGRIKSNGIKLPKDNVISCLMNYM